MLTLRAYGFDGGSTGPHPQGASRLRGRNGPRRPQFYVRGTDSNSK